MSTHYETLAIPREANAERVKRSYRSLVKIYHPDKFPSGSKEEAETGKRIREINAAYAVLSNPHKRASYDAELNTPPDPEPEHCARCSKPTGYWRTNRKKASLCYMCAVGL